MSASIGSLTAPEDDIFRFADENALSGGEKVAPPAMPDGGGDQTDGARTAKRRYKNGQTCLSCGESYPSSAKLCPPCGIDLKTGRSILMVDDSDVDKIYVRAEAIITTVSWFFWTGFLPVASEAFGTAKPYVARGITLVTCLVSCWFFAYLWTDRHDYDNLMLWAGDASGDLVERFLAENELSQSDFTEAEWQEIRAEVAANIPRGRFEPYQLVTHAFLHADLIHLAGNMLLFIVFGNRVNSALGNLWFAVLYPFWAVSAAACHLLSESGGLPSPMLGASGAVMGAAGMYLVLFPVNIVHFAAWLRMGLIGGFSLHMNIWPIRGFWVVLLYIAFDVLYTTFGIEDGTAHWAHLGGFMAGAGTGVFLLVTRLVDGRGADIFSALLGRHAWAIVGRPGRRVATASG